MELTCVAMARQRVALQCNGVVLLRYATEQQSITEICDGLELIGEGID